MLQQFIGGSWYVGGQCESGPCAGLDKIELDKPKEQLWMFVHDLFKP